MRALVWILVWFGLVSRDVGALVAAIPMSILFDSSNALHRDITYHPEQPSRITETIRALGEFQKSRDLGYDLIRLVDVAETSVLDEYGGVVKDAIVHEPFSEAELAHARSILLKTHKEDLVTKLEEKCNSGKERRRKEGKIALGHLGYLDPDTFVTTETFNVCLRATAAWIRAVEQGASSGRPVMALTRPPGHHATRDLSNGFCIYNFAAAAALHVMLQDPTKRVSILDWDVHYGQGVADIIQHYPNARYVSIHQTPAFPYMGESRKVLGNYQNVLTIPIPAETSWTCGYRDAFSTALEFVSSTKVAAAATAAAGDNNNHSKWSPDVVIVCAGYDALDSDELASVSLQSPDYGQMAKLLQQHLREHSSGSGKMPALILGLEGGYQLSPWAGGGNLQQAVVETIQGLIDY